jgi:hypothetical protein
MARCEDFPYCGHEPGCCPDFDEAGRQLNMKCTCGATVPLGSKSSLCEACLNYDAEVFSREPCYDPDDDVDADAFCDDDGYDCVDYDYDDY